MSEPLHPDMVAAGIFYLDDEKMQRLAGMVGDLARLKLKGIHADETYVSLVTDFLLREVGYEELLSQYWSYKIALRDTLLSERRQ